MSSTKEKIVLKYRTLVNDLVDILEEAKEMLIAAERAKPEDFPVGAEFQTIKCAKGKTFVMH